MNFTPPDRAAPPAQTLGMDLRTLRKARGLTLSDTAGRIGKSVGWLSQVERDISSPSLEDLKALARLYGVPLSLLFGAAEAPEAERGRIVRAGGRRVLGQGEGGLAETLVSPDLTDGFEVIHSVFAPGARSAGATERPTQEIVYLVSGRLELTLAGRPFLLAPGDSARIRGEPFAWVNPHDMPAEAVWVIAPPVY